MKFDQEARRTAAQFLNGIAVALVAALVLAPAANGAFRVVVASCGLGAAGLLHLVALCVSRR